MKDNKVWMGPSITSGDRKFYVPNDYELNAAGCGIDETGRKYIRVKGVRWFTNLDHKKRHYPLDMYKHYSPEEYPKYDNYDAINVDKTSDIPMDYDGVMGVPVTFLDKYCPEQFEIVEFRKDKDGKNLVYSTIESEPDLLQNTDPATSIAGVIKNAEGKIGGKITYARILIRKK